MKMLEALALAGMGKPVEPLELLRNIVPDDLPLLAQEQREHNWARDSSPTKLVSVLRTGHHQLAQLLGAGISVPDASLITGRSPHAIQLLLADPAFKELMAYYEAQNESRDFDAYKRLVTLGGTAIEVLQERIEDNPDLFTNNELRQLIESTMDRSAAPAKGDPRLGASKGTGLNVNINFVPARPVGQVIDADTVEVKQIEELKDA